MDKQLQWLSTHESPDATFLGMDPPLILARGQGDRVFDEKGRSYIDMIAGFGALPLGHNPPELRRILADPEGLWQGLGDLYPSQDKVDFLKALFHFLSPPMERAALVVTGAQAVEYALRTAFLKTKKPGVIAFQGGYHGLDLGVLQTTPWEMFKTPFHPLMSGPPLVKHLPWDATWDDLDKGALAMAQEGVPVGAILVEPIQGRGGGRIASRPWLETLRQGADRLNALLIYDEIFCGLGRGGVNSFASLVPPDLLCLGKMLGGGLPLSACVGTKASFEGWPVNRGEALFTGTFFGHPLACRVGRGVLETISEQGLVERSRRLGAWFLQALQEKAAHVPAIREVRGQGLMITVEGIKPLFGVQSMHTLRQRGLLVLPCGEQGEGFSLTPALNVEEKTLERVVDILF